MNIAIKRSNNQNEKIRIVCFPIKEERGESEFIYLPCSDIEINKALMRLNVPYWHDCEVIIDTNNVSNRILN